MNKQMTVHKDYDGFGIDFNEDGWFNATKAAAIFGKRPVDWLRLKETKEYIEALMEILNTIDKTNVIKTIRGKYGGGTWLHPTLAVAFARWLNPRFAVWCDSQVKTILTSKLLEKALIDREKEKAEIGYIYIIEFANNHVKIGKSINPTKRINGLRYSVGRAIKDSWVSIRFKGYSEIESILHAKFSDKRKIGEYFSITHNEAVRAAESAIADKEHLLAKFRPQLEEMQ